MDGTARMTTEIGDGEGIASDFAFAEALPQLFFAAGPDGRPLYYNRRWYEYTGLPRRDSPGPDEDWIAPLHPGDVDRCRRAWAACLEGGEALRVDCRIRSRDGGWRWFEGLACPRRDAQGRIASWLGTCTDVDELKRGIAALSGELEAARGRERRLRGIAEAPGQILWWADAAGAVASWSPRWSEYTGATAAEGLGRAWLAFVHPDDRRRVEEAWRAGIESDRAWETDLRLLRGRDGDARRHLLRAAPIRDESGATAEWAGSLADVEDLLERLVAERTAELRRSNEDLERFALVASHELQEPLRKVQAFGDRLEARIAPQLDAQGADYLRRMVTGAERMRKLIRDLLSLSRMGGSPRSFEDVNLDAVVRAAVGDLEQGIERSGGRVEAAPLGAVRGDPAQLQRLFQNLIGNSLKYHQPGRPPTVRVSRGESREPGACEILVQDDGIGFDAKDAERIFDAFERLHGRSQYEGSGLGLAICRRIVERHSGRISATGSPGAGATFRVVLPQGGGGDA